MTSNLTPHETPECNIWILFDNLHMVAWSPGCFDYSAAAGEWLRRMKQIRDWENMKDEQIINISCGILSDVPEWKRITTISFVDRLKKKLLDIEENHTAELGLYSWAAIDTITRVLFHSFDMCCYRMDDHEVDDDFKRLVEEYDKRDKHVRYRRF